MPTPVPFDWLSDLNPALNAQRAWEDGNYDAPRLFHLVYNPDGPFAISCGAGLLAEHVRRFRFTPDLILHMGQITDDNRRPVFSESFLNHLQRLRLRVNVWAAPEGMLLLPGEPLAVIRGPYEQVLLMETALTWLMWRSTQWATRMAYHRWENQYWREEDTPLAPVIPFNFDGWKIRAAYIGGAFADEILETIKTPSRMPEPGEGLIHIPYPGQNTLPLTQIRRVYKGNHALGDIWLTPEMEERASVSKTSAEIVDVHTKRHRTLKFRRFQNMYQPLLVKGHPVLANQRLAYLRQRMLKQLEAFHFAPLSKYPSGWLA
ncbi:MAG: hypothetical protein EP344_01835 [Bacteroidetes bacterium]|nr:MAG: hypothetical protein EP344_01835 [Bacteroidota bacterium]